jgi:hypothetical protein
MQIIGYAVYGIAVFLAGTFFIGIRSNTARGAGVTRQTVNTTMLFTVSLVVVPLLSLSPFHLLWMFPISFVLGALSLAFPFSLLSIPGRGIFHIACIGLDQKELRKRQDRIKKLQSVMMAEGVTAEQAKAKLEELGEW